MKVADYNAHEWSSGEVITKDKMNHLEQGIEDMVNTLPDILQNVTFKNLFNPDDGQYGLLYSNGSNIAASDEWYTSGWIKLETNTTYVFRYWQDIVHGYDNDVEIERYCRYTGMSMSGSKLVGNHVKQIVVPPAEVIGDGANNQYIRFSFKSQYKDKILFCRLSDLNTKVWIPYGENIPILKDSIVFKSQIATAEDLYDLSQYVNQCNDEQLQDMIGRITQVTNRINMNLREIDALQQYTNRLNILIEQYNNEQTKELVNHFTEATNKINITMQEIDSLQQIVTKIENSTADAVLQVNSCVNTIGNLLIETDSHENRLIILEKLTEHINDLLTVITAFSTQLDQINSILIHKVDKTELNAIAFNIDTLNNKLEEFEPLNESEIGSLLIDIDQLQRRQNTNISQIASLLTQVSNKMDIPSIMGTSGQVLTLTASGATYWSDPTIPSSEQIGTAVSDWLEDHPEATTTVEDGSITLDKLADEVVNLIGEGEDKDAQLIIAALTNQVNAEANISQEIQDKVNLVSQWKTKLITHSARYTNPGFGFLFFTDPHNLTPQYDSTPASLLKDLKYIGTIYSQTPCKYAFCGGDWLNTEHLTPEEASWTVGRIVNLMRSEIGSNAFTIFGNHDDNSEWVGSSSSQLTRFQLGNMWYQQDNCYLILNATNDLDIYLLDMSYSMNLIYDYQWNELNWLAQQLLINNKPHLFGLGHMLYSSDSMLFGQAICDLLNAFNQKTTITLNNITYNFNNAVGTWHFLIGGHEHSDKTRTVSNIPIIITDDFRDSKAIDLCYADFITNKLYLDRVGLGSSRSVNIIPTGDYQVN